MSSRYTIAQARDQLPRLVHEAEAGSPVELTRRGKPVAVLLSIDQYQRMAAHRPSFWEALQDFRAQVDWPAVGIAGDEFENVRDRGRGRRVRL